MSRKRKSNAVCKPGAPEAIPVMNANAAGMDIGANEIYVAVPADRDRQPVRCFGTFTGQLMELSEWLQQCRIETVAMEATGVYWIPVYQILETASFDVCLVNARYFQNVPGRKTDVSDCQWLQRLHAAGLLRGSFRPAQQVCVLRSLTRHRDNLIQLASTHTLHMQKALDQMNVQLHHVLSDLTGLSGLAILDAILSGERDPRTLARLRDGRVKASEETIVQALTGDYRAEHLFTLKQSLATYRYYQRLLTACDLEIERQLKRFDANIDVKERPLPPPQGASQKDLQQRAEFRSTNPSLPHLRSGPDRGARDQRFDRAYHPVGDWPRHREVSQRGGVRVLARTMSTQRHQRRQSAQRENAPGEESSCSGIPDGSQRAIPEPVAVGRFLPADAGKARGSQSHHSRSAQAGAYCVPHALQA